MFKERKRKSAGEVNTSSTADIAFLLLIFFLVTTTINSEKGIGMMLPPKNQDTEVDVKARNILNILVNSSNQVMADEEGTTVEEVTDICKKFITNNGRDPESSESPKKAIVSIKADRGTNYDSYIKVLDAVKAAYNDLRAQHVGMEANEFRLMDLKKPENKAKYDQAKEAFPMMISEAEPSVAK